MNSDKSQVHNSTEKVFSLCADILQLHNISFSTHNLRQTVNQLYDLEFMKAVYVPEDYSRFFEWKDVERDPFIKIELLSAILKTYGIGTETDELGLDGLPDINTPFIAIIKTGEEASPFEFVIVTSQNSGHISYLHPYKGVQHITKPKFEEAWTNAVVTFRATRDAGTKQISRAENTLNIFISWALVSLAGLIMIIAVISMLSQSVPATAWLLLLMIKAAGLFICIQLQKIAMDGTYSSRVLENFCSRGERFSCKTVLSSKASRLIAWISMADTGVIYFGSTLAVLTISALTHSFHFAAPVLFLMTAICLPYTFFSVYYQGFVIKRWCMLCLTVQASFWAELIIWYFAPKEIHGHSYSYLLVTVCIGVFIAFLLKNRRESLQMRNSLEASTRTTRFFLENYNVLKARIEENAVIDQTLLPGELHLNSDVPSGGLMVLLDPHCPFCAREYNHLRSVQHSRLANVQVTVRLICGDNYVPVLRHLLAWTLKGHNIAALQLLDTWYAFKISSAEKAGARVDEHDFGYNMLLYDRWRKEIPSIENADDLEYAYNRHAEWHTANIASLTPAIFINGHLWPPEYNFANHLDEVTDILKEPLSVPVYS